MRLTKLFAAMALAAGLGAGTLAAQDWDSYQRRDLRHDYDRVARMRADIARGRARLDADIRYGRGYAASRNAADLARDRRALAAQMRDIRRDWR